MSQSNEGKMAAARAEFPYLEEEVNGRPLVYLDSAASSQKPGCVIDRMATFTRREYANVHRGIHRLSERATNAYEGCRDSLREWVNAREREEIVFTSGTTAAVNLVAQAWGPANLRAGDRILLTEMEHHSNLLPWQELARRMGAEVDYVPVRKNGVGLDLEAARQLLERKPKLFAFAHVSNTLGVENPAAQLCQWAKEAGAVAFVDAAQSVGHQAVDVQAMGCDFLACSSHKMCGPSGIGLLYGRKELLSVMPPWQFGGEMVASATFERPALYRESPAKFEAGTPPIIEAAGWDEAVRFLGRVGLDAIHDHGVRLAELAACGLAEISRVRCLGPTKRAASLVTFSVEGIHAHDLAFFCDQRGVAIRAGHHCAQPLMKKLGIPSSVRASFYLYNTSDEVEVLLQTVRDAIRFFR